MWQYSTGTPPVWLDYDGPPSDIKLEANIERECYREQTSTLRRTLQLKDTGRVYRCAVRWNGTMWVDQALSFPVGAVTLSGKKELVHRACCSRESLYHFTDPCGGGGGGGRGRGGNRLVGLVVKASASGAEDPGFKSRLRRDFSGGESYRWLKNLALQWLPCQAPGVIGSALGLVGPVSVYCDWVRWTVGSATSISVWQHLKLSRSVPEIHSLGR